MERNSKVMSIVALFVAVVGLTIGFAAFSNTLTIKSSATVTPNASDFKVELSSSADSVVSGAVTPTGNGETATIEAGKTVISGLKLTAVDPGESVKYTIYAHNTGKYDAYLKEINFLNIEGENVFKTCTTESGEINDKVTGDGGACNGINVSVVVPDEFGFTAGAGAGIQPSSAYGDFRLGTEEEQVMKIEILIGYEDAWRLPDEAFDVEFGDIELVFSSVGLE